ncbi:MAG: hypothetical protein M3301_05540 [Chloroflexota bacterium]|nr:hypothetical protein [Chloroflexota bacterium]
MSEHLRRDVAPRDIGARRSTSRPGEHGTPDPSEGGGRPARLSRGATFFLLALACLAVAVGYVIWAALRSQATAAGPRPSPVPVSAGGAEAIGAVEREPHLVFQNVVRDENYAKIALAPLSAPNGPRTMTSLVCERVHYAAGQGLCLLPEKGLVSRLQAQIFGPDFQPHHTIPLNGSPTRARVSPDGRYAAATAFVYGHSYADANFSTQTTIIDIASGTHLGDLERFAVSRNGQRWRAPDFNLWGVTFARDSNRFYATLRTGGKTYLVEGDVAARSVRVLRENVECPSLSPDNTRIAFKKLIGEGPAWRLHVLDLATMTDRPTSETRSIDDQVEWLDDKQIVYAFGADLWVAAAEGNGRPRMLVSQALSPAVVR